MNDITIAYENNVLKKYSGTDFCFEVTERVTAIGESAFEGNLFLKEIRLPDSVKSLEYRAFKNCRILERIVIPESVTRIENSVFSSCQKIKDFNIPQNLESIGEYVFYGDERLMRFHLADGIVRVCIKDTYSFQHDTNLLKAFLCEHDLQKRKQQFQDMGEAKYKSAIAFYLLCSGQADEDIRKYAKRNITKTAMTELFATGFITKKNIDKLIEYAIEKQNYDIQLLLMNYKSEHIGYEDSEEMIKRKFRL